MEILDGNLGKRPRTLGRVLCGKREKHLSLSWAFKACTYRTTKTART